jgi:hypothetical protein
MAKPLCKKGFPLFNDIAGLVDGTCATGKNAFRAGQQTPAPPTQNTATSALTSYKPVIDLELLGLSFEGARISDEEMDLTAPLVSLNSPLFAPLTTVQDITNTSTTANTPRKTIFEREIESLISTVSSLIHMHTDVLTNARMMKPQRRKKIRERLFRRGLPPPPILGMTGAKCIGSQ